MHNATPAPTTSAAHAPLLGGLRGLLSRDNNPLKRALLRKFLQCHPATAAGFALAGASRFSALCSVRAYYLLNVSFLTVAPTQDFLTMLIHPGERLAFERTILCKARVAHARKSLAGLFMPWRLRLRTCMALTRLFSRLLRRYDLYVVLRAAEYLACYSRLVTGVGNRPLTGILIFTDTNPHGFALMAAARRLGVPAYFIAHGEPHAPIHPLHCRGALLLGEASLRHYEAAGSTFQQTHFQGHHDTYRPVSPVDASKSLTIGVFLGKLSSLQNLRAILEQLAKQFRVQDALIRSHPNALFSERRPLQHLVPAPMRVVASRSLPEDVERCDLILSGNSTAQIDALLRGKPLLFCKELDDGHDDLYGYVADGLIMPWAPTLTLEGMNRFYRGGRRDALHRRLNLNQTAEESIARFNRYVFDT